MIWISVTILLHILRAVTAIYNTASMIRSEVQYTEYCSKGSEQGCKDGYCSEKTEQSGRFIFDRRPI